MFRADDLPVRHCVVMQASDRRPVFAVPRGEYVYVGTTDTSYDGAARRAGGHRRGRGVSARGDGAHLRERIARRRAGRRRLGGAAAARPRRGSGARPRSRARTRSRSSASGLVTIAGGKLTTYRRMAERVVDAAAPLLGQSCRRPRAPIGSRWREAIWAARPISRPIARSAEVRAAFEGVPPDTASRLIDVHGSDALEVVQEAGGSPEALVAARARCPADRGRGPSRGPSRDGVHADRRSRAALAARALRHRSRTVPWRRRWDASWQRSSDGTQRACATSSRSSIVRRLPVCGGETVTARQGARDGKPDRIREDLGKIVGSTRIVDRSRANRARAAVTPG